MIPFGVYYANDIELYQDFAISCGTNIQQNQDFTITLDVINDGAYTFVGDFDVSLFNLDGTFAETVQTLSGASLDPGYYYDDIEFVSSGLTIAPGTYLLALMHKEDVGEWQLSGSSYYSNPIFVTIQEQDENSDSYEDNNSQLDAYQLSLGFSNNNASVSTSGSNVHIGSDVDFYKIGLLLVMNIRFLQEFMMHIILEMDRIIRVMLFGLIWLAKIGLTHTTTLCHQLLWSMVVEVSILMSLHILLAKPAPTF